MRQSENTHTHTHTHVYTHTHTHTCTHTHTHTRVFVLNSEKYKNDILAQKIDMIYKNTYIRVCIGTQNYDLISKLAW